MAKEVKMNDDQKKALEQLRNEIDKGLPDGLNAVEMEDLYDDYLNGKITPYGIQGTLMLIGKERAKDKKEYEQLSIAQQNLLDNLDKIDKFTTQDFYTALGFKNKKKFDEFYKKHPERNVEEDFRNTFGGKLNESYMKYVRAKGAEDLKKERDELVPLWADLFMPRTAEMIRNPDMVKGDVSGDLIGAYQTILDNPDVAKRVVGDLGENLLLFAQPAKTVVKAPLIGSRIAEKTATGAGKGLMTLFDNAAVPFAIEGMDALLGNDDEFQYGAATAGTMGNLVAPYMLKAGLARPFRVFGANNVANKIDNLGYSKAQEFDNMLTEMGREISESVDAPLDAILDTKYLRGLLDNKKVMTLEERAKLQRMLEQLKDIKSTKYPSKYANRLYETDVMNIARDERMAAIDKSQADTFEALKKSLITDANIDDALMKLDEILSSGGIRNFDGSLYGTTGSKPLANVIIDPVSNTLVDEINMLPTEYRKLYETAFALNPNVKLRRNSELLDKKLDKMNKKNSRVVVAGDERWGLPKENAKPVQVITGKGAKFYNLTPAQGKIMNALYWLYNKGQDTITDEKRYGSLGSLLGTRLMNQVSSSKTAKKKAAGAPGIVSNYFADFNPSKEDKDEE